MQMNANQFPEIYQGLKIDLNDLGCVMLDVELGQAIMGADKFIGDNAYVSENEKRYWIAGVVGLVNPHMTLLYGLLEKATKHKKDIEKLMKGWSLENVKIGEVGFFPSPYADDPYYCIVAHVKTSPEMIEGRQRLEMLPHINTFVGYQPHITLAYIKKDQEFLAEALDWFNTRLHSALIPVKPTLNLGDK